MSAFLPTLSILVCWLYQYRSLYNTKHILSGLMLVLAIVNQSAFYHSKNVHCFTSYINREGSEELGYVFLEEIPPLPPP